MRNISGFVCFADFENSAVLYGKSINNLPKFYENWQGNSLTPYDTLKDAKKACVLVKKDLDALKTVPARVHMRIAGRGNLDEIKKLSERSLVVVLVSDDFHSKQMLLMGMCVDGAPSAYPLYGAYMRDTKFTKTINSCSYALDVAYQGERQAQFKAQIAEFYLEKLL
ncbi:MAG: hypothetical protein V1839_02720 [archaeon]